MRILYVTSEIPYPLTTGLLRHYHLAGRLARRHEITLACLSRRGGIGDEARGALDFASDLIVTPAARGEGRTAGPVSLRVAARRLAAVVGEAVAEGRFDAAIVSGKTTYPVLPVVQRLPVVADVCDATALRLRAAARYGRRRARALVRMAEVRYAERAMVRTTRFCTFVSERDRAAVMRGPGGYVVPNGVDTDVWRAGRPHDAVPPVVVFAGALHARPNHHAAMRLIQGIAPRVHAFRRDARFVVAGRAPLRELRAAVASQPGAELIADPSDVRAVLDHAAVACVPLTIASGTQNKVLEAWAMGLPVVTTPVVAEGATARGDAPPVVVAESDEALAGALLDLLADPTDARRLGDAGRAYVERHYDWERSAEALEELCLRAVNEHRTAPASAGRAA